MIIIWHISSNITPDIASLNIETAASLKQQKQQDARKSRDGKAPAKAQEQPLMAPQPTRASSAGNIWNAEGGIRFGSNGPVENEEDNGAKTVKPKATNWDPNKPIRFGWF
jgi:hypothetical protein